MAMRPGLTEKQEVEITDASELWFYYMSLYVVELSGYIKEQTHFSYKSLDCLDSYSLI